MQIPRVITMQVITAAARRRWLRRRRGGGGWRNRQLRRTLAYPDFSNALSRVKPPLMMQQLQPRGVLVESHQALFPLL